MADSLQTDVLNAKNYLQSQHMKIHDEWVDGYGYLLYFF